MTGDMDIKGLAGKKSNTPPFVRKLFTDVTDALKEIETRNDIDPVLEKVTGTITGCIQKLRAGTIPLESMAFTNMLGWNLKDYSITLKQDDIERESLDVESRQAPVEECVQP